jgi:hypothetical protein
MESWLNNDITNIQLAGYPLYQQLQKLKHGALVTGSIKKWSDEADAKPQVPGFYRWN